MTHNYRGRPRKYEKGAKRVDSDERKELIRYAASRYYHINNHGGDYEDDRFICSCGKVFAVRGCH
jgi:hypothetical protein